MIDHSDLPERDPVQELLSGDYASAIGWDPEAEADRRRHAAIEKHRREHGPEYVDSSIFTWGDAADIFDREAVPAPGPLELFGPLVRECELTVLFGEAGCGKSMLAMQIADAVARGADAIENDKLRNAAGPMLVMYLDFEMTRGQIAERYSRGLVDGRWLDPYPFQNLRLPDIDWLSDPPGHHRDHIDYIIHSIWRDVERMKPGFLVVDNITYLQRAPLSSTESRRTIAGLKQMKDSCGLAILVLAHTPKRRRSRPIHPDDLAGRKEIANFIDNCFAVGRSHSRAELRYIKQIKQRNRPEEFGEENVVLCEIGNPSGNFPRFGFVEFTHERPHLFSAFHPTGSAADDAAAAHAAARRKLIAEARRLAASGHTQRQIAEKLGIGLATVNRYLARRKK